MKEEQTDYGPLAKLIGVWSGSQGMDVAPEPDGPAHMPYSETIRFEAAGSVDNAETQLISAVYYHQLVKRDSDGEIFHNQTGYWMWDRSENTVMHSFTIPRAVSIVASGRYRSESDAVVLSVSTETTGGEPRIAQSPFMQSNASTRLFAMDLTISSTALHYRQTTIVDIYGNEFEHTDESRLIRQA